MSNSGLSSTVGALIFGVVFFILGLVMVFAWGYPTLEKAKASEKWPTTIGSVTESGVSKNTDDDKTTYTPDVCYQYSVYGQSYFGADLYVAGNTGYSSSAAAHREVSKYPVGASVKVYYDPESHSTAVLENGVTTSCYIPIIVGGVFAAIGFLVAAFPAFKLFAAMFAIGSSMKSDPPETAQYSHPDNSNERYSAPTSTGSYPSADALPNTTSVSEGFTIQ